MAAVNLEVFLFTYFAPLVSKVFLARYFPNYLVARTRSATRNEWKWMASVPPCVSQTGLTKCIVLYRLGKVKRIASVRVRGRQFWTRTLQRKEVEERVVQAPLPTKVCDWILGSGQGAYVCEVQIGDVTWMNEARCRDVKPTKNNKTVFRISLRERKARSQRSMIDAYSCICYCYRTYFSRGPGASNADAANVVE